MIVVDTSVWIDYFRRIETPATLFLLRGHVQPRRIIVGDVVLLEVLMGARDERMAERLAGLLATFRQEALLTPETAPLAAENYRRLRAVGVTPRQTTDLIVASFCIAWGHELLFSDRDFLPMVTHLGLRPAMASGSESR